MVLHGPTDGVITFGLCHHVVDVDPVAVVDLVAVDVLVTVVALVAVANLVEGTYHVNLKFN